MTEFSYLHLGEEADPATDMVCKYRVTTDLTMEKAAEAIAAEQSTGTWTELSTLSESVIKKYGARVLAIEDDLITIAFPDVDFSVDVGGIPQILSVVSGNLYGLDALKEVRFEDIQFPRSIRSMFRGPRFGADGIRKLVGRPEKPLIGTIVKPKIGLSPKETAEYVYEAGSGGLTNSKDDETLVNQKFCPIQDRTIAIAEVLDKLASEGNKMIHAINVSTNGDKILEVAENAQSWGAKQLMVDVITCGFAAVQVLSEDPSIKIPIHVHRTMHGAMTKNLRHGVAMLPIVKMVRMCGGDALHIGTLGAGKMAGDIQGDRNNLNACMDPSMPYRTVMPVCSGGVFPGMVGKMLKETGFNVQIQAGGGVAGHPGGVRSGATAMSQAVTAVYNGSTIEQYAKTHKELAQALDKWGIRE